MNIQTSWGIITVELQSDLAVRCTLPHLEQDPDIAFFVNSLDEHPVIHFIRALFEGRKAEVPPYHLSGGTPFQHAVWRGIAQIPFGQTCTYGELAHSINHSTAVRAVANACGRNPLPLFIPCHRVVAAGSRLGGFSSGLAWKRLLLKNQRNTAHSKRMI